VEDVRDEWGQEKPSTRRETSGHRLYLVGPEKICQGERREVEKGESTLDWATERGGTRAQEATGKTATDHVGEPGNEQQREEPDELVDSVLRGESNKREEWVGGKEADIILLDYKG